jgi:acyl carrier protein
VLEELPLTPNGKVDRKALPIPDALEDSAEKTIILPRTQIEELLLAIWRSVLGRKHMSIEDNFFELGGHSLLATQLLTRLRSAFGIQLQLRSLFEAPTIASQSILVEAALRAEQQIESLPLIPVSREQKLPLSFAQQRLWFLDKLHPGDAASNIPLAIQLTGTLNVDALRWSIQEIVKRHESLRTNFLTIDGEAVQVIAPASRPFSLSVIDLSSVDGALREQQVKALMQQEVQRPFDLEHDMLIRASLVMLNEQEHIFLLTMHHIISDGWSLGVFSYELQTLYQAYIDKKVSPLAPLAIQYADFAVWQRQWLQGQTLDAHLTYWKQRLSGAHAYQYPLDHPRPEQPKRQGANYTFSLSAELLQAVKELGQQQGITLYMTLLAAFMMTLVRTTGDEDIIVGTDIANRTSKETEALIGFFVNLLALRVDLGGNPTFYQLLARVRDCVLGAYTYQDLPYDVLVDHLHIERTYGQTPLINCLFVLHNIPVNEVTIQPEREQQATLTMTELSNEVTMAKFDFAVFLAETTEGLVGSINYSTELFERSSMEKLIGHFINLLKQSLERPDVVISDLEMYSEEEMHEQRKLRQERRSNTLRKLSGTKGNRISISEK